MAGMVLASCAEKAGVDATVQGASDRQIFVKQLSGSSYSVLDTVKTDASGRLKYRLDVKKGQPEFVYLFYGDTRIATLLLEKGERAVVSADTLGNYSVEGSEGSAKLAVVDKSYAKFRKDIAAASNDPAAMSKIYISHYRECVKHLLENPYSMTDIPVLYEKLGDVSPIFSRPTDAIFFRQVADSLKTVYPDSRYVKALDAEAARREKALRLNSTLLSAKEASFPDIVLPDISGKDKALSSVEAKVILVHFWNAADNAQKMLNIDSLLPIYNDFHSLGFEIYAVCVSPDKAEWGSVVHSQELPWINVNDGLGTSSPAVSTYNISALPSSMLIVNGEVSTAKFKDSSALRRELDRLLRR